MNYIFINIQPFSFTKSVKINFCYIQECSFWGKIELKKGLDIANQKYEYRGFGIKQYHGDNELEKIIPHLLPPALHICAKNEHIGGIYCESLTVKERVRCSFISTTYKHFTNLITKAVTQYAI